eukprot:12422076-Heterocapsa_arctica.AAC.1
MLHELLQYYVKLDEKAKNCNFNDQLKTKIEVKNGLDTYCFTMCNTLDEEKLKNKFDGDDMEKIEMCSLGRQLLLDLHEFRVNKESKLTLHRLIFTMRNTLIMEMLKEKSESDEKAKINS